MSHLVIHQHEQEQMSETSLQTAVIQSEASEVLRDEHKDF